MGFNVNNLSEVADVIDSLHKTPRYVESGYSMVRCTDVKYGHLKLDQTFKVTEEVFDDFSKRYKPKKNDIIITRVGSYGITAIVGESAFCLGQNTSAIIPKINPRYLYAVLNSSYIRHQIEFSVVGSTQKTLSLKAIKNLKIPRFETVVEDKIAEILGGLDDKIELNSQTNQTLEQIAQAIFKSWFVDFEPVKAKQHIRALGGNGEQTERAAQAVIAGAVNLENITTATDLSELDWQVTDALSGKLAHQTEAQREQLASTARQFPDRLVELESGLIPEGWEVASIDDIADVIDCLHSKKPKEVIDGADNLYLQLNNIGDDGLLYLDKAFLISDEDYEKWVSRIEVRIGDCLITNVGRVGVAASIPGGVKAAIGRNMTAVRLHDEKPYQAFLITLLTSRYMRLEIEYHTDVGTILNALNVKSIPKLRFNNPSDRLLQIFEEVAQSLLSKRQLHVKESASLANLRDTLLPKLLSGELSINESDRICDAVV